MFVQSRQFQFIIMYTKLKHILCFKDVLNIFIEQKTLILKVLKWSNKKLKLQAK